MAAEMVVSGGGGAHRDCFSLLLESNKKHKVKGECRIKIQTNWRKKRDQGRSFLFPGGSEGKNREL